MCNLAMKSRFQAAFTQGPGFIRCLPLSRHLHHHICSSCKQVFLTLSSRSLTPKFNVTSDFEAVVDEYLSHYNTASPDLVCQLLRK